MNTANQKRIEVVASPPCAEFRPRGSTTTTSTGRYARIQGIAIFIAAAALVAFATNLSMHLLNLRMQQLGISELDIGFSVAAQALGIVLVAPLVKRVVATVGIRTTFVVGALISSTSLIVFNFASDFVLIALLRLVFAIGLALLFTVSESLVITKTDSGNRGAVVGWYATALAVGTASGPAFVAVTGVEGIAPLMWGALLFWLPITPLLFYFDGLQELAPVIRNSTIRALRVMPVAFITAFVFGIVDNGGMSMLSIYGALNGYDYSQAALLASVAMAGGIALQIPLGYASNRYEPRIVMLLCAVGAMATLTMLPHIMPFRLAALSLSFVLGGLLEGLYTIGLICIAKYCRNVGISAANGCFVSICGLGELVGPLSTGTSIHYLGTHGFVIGLTIPFAIYILSIACVRSSEELKPASS